MAVAWQHAEQRAEQPCLGDGASHIRTKGSRLEDLWKSAAYCRRDALCTSKPKRWGRPGGRAYDAIGKGAKNS